MHVGLAHTGRALDGGHAAADAVAAVSACHMHKLWGSLMHMPQSPHAPISPPLQPAHLHHLHLCAPYPALTSCSTCPPPPKGPLTLQCAACVFARLARPPQKRPFAPRGARALRCHAPFCPPEAHEPCAAMRPFAPPRRKSPALPSSAQMVHRWCADGVVLSVHCSCARSPAPSSSIDPHARGGAAPHPWRPPAGRGPP